MKRVERIISFLLVVFLLSSPIFISTVNAFDAPRIYVKELNINKTSFNAGDNISGDFLMWNTTDGIVTDLDYKISLIKNHQVFGGKIFPVSSQIYPNGTYRQSFSYAVPENIASGSYIMFVRLYTKTGMPLNWGQKDIVVSGNNNLLRISNSKLMQGDNEFQPMAGINFDSKENPPAAAFRAYNSSAKNIEFDLRVTVYAVQPNMKELESFSAEKGVLDSGKTRNFSITLPKYETAGTYLAKISFYEKNILVSNEESFRWVIKGQSARILKVVSGEDFFQKDKIAKITVDVIGPADGSSLEGANLTVSIFGKDGKILVSSNRDIRLGSSVNTEVFDLTPSADVLSPRIEAKIVKDGKVLDSYITEIKTAGDTDESVMPIQSQENESSRIEIFSLVLIMILLLVFIIILGFFKNKKIFSLILLTISLAAGMGIFYAVKINNTLVEAQGLDDLVISWTEPIENSVYNFGGNISFSGEANIAMCINGVSSLSAESYICDRDDGSGNCVRTDPGDFFSVIPKGLAYVKEASVGYYYVLDIGGRVMKYRDPDKAMVAVYGENGNGAGKLKNPQSIFYSQPYIYVADTGNNRIVRFNPTAADWLTTWQAYGVYGEDGSVEGNFTSPYSVFYDTSTELSGSGSGYIYAVERGSHNRVVRFKIDGAGNFVGGTWQIFGNGVGVGKGYFRAPGGVFYDKSTDGGVAGAGYIYVAGGWGSQIIKFKPGDMMGTWQKIGADSLTNIEVTDGGSGYTSVPNVVISGGGATTNATATAILGTGADSDKVASITVDTGGMGYTSVPNVVISGGGATIDAIATASNFDSFGGSGVGQFGNPKGVYYDSDTDYVYVSGGDSVVRFRASEMKSGSRVVPVSDWTDFGEYGSGMGRFNLVRGAIYNSATENIYTADEGNYRIVKLKPAEEFASATSTINLSGVVTDINITDRGDGYTSVPTVTISGGGGSGATAVVDSIAGKKVRSIVITNGGSGYTSAPNVTISKIGAWDEINFTDPIAYTGFFPYRINTTVPVSFSAPFALGPSGEAFAKVIVRAVDGQDNFYETESYAPIFIATPPPTYTVSGNVFVDDDKDKVKDTLPLPGESNYTVAAPTITIDYAGATSNTLADGTYTISNLPAGTYTVSYTSLPAGYSMVWPFPANLQVTVGPSCNVADTTTGGSCAGDNVIDLNFAISNSMSWIQTYGLDLRVDDGFDNPIPATADVACGGGPYASGTTGSFTSPGIIFSGDGSAAFGLGFASSTDWRVGGGSWPEVFESTKPLKTSTLSLLAAAAKAGIDPTELESLGAWCNNPSTGCNLNPLGRGFYHTSGDIEIDQNANFNNGNYVIVSDGTIRITKEITVAAGSTVIFSARDIIIDSSIGTAPACPVPASPVPGGQLQGIFSADRDIIIEGNNGVCTAGADIMLNIDGALIANAAQLSGSFQNNRDLCADNVSYPSITIKARPDFILNSPGFLSQQNVISREEAP